MSDLPTINVYGPEAWHDDAYVVTTKEGLEDLLRNLFLLKAKGEGHVKIPAFAGDGEAYCVRFILANDDAIALLRTHYTSGEAKEASRKPHPLTLIRSVAPDENDK